ncbi:MAG: 30S ribosomal protein S12 methylthiotransferase RimO [Candidatus Omnitrophica bacterium]|nr:30S ribosomal protein S12 methylthiotransferase RimO [Candidatus Omnitrophota bacterium]
MVKRDRHARQTRVRRLKQIPIRIGLLSLGCPKTLVDSENILAKFPSPRFSIVPSIVDCDVALLNTCAFIQEAQQESVDRILDLLELKKEGRIRALVVIGCLVQRFSKELRTELKDHVDAFVGSGEYEKIPSVVDYVLEGRKVFSVGLPGYLATSGEGRVPLTPPHYRYLKISEGCDHLCSFCTIPTFRGKHRSREIGDIVDESKRLIEEGAKELILTGQDTTAFGRDREGKDLLPDLLLELDKISGVKWIRLLYAYPTCVSERLMEVMQDSKHICHYLDLPLQHISDRILRAMKRGITKRRTVEIIERFRERIPDLTVRTSFIVGFPGETDRDFQELLDFMEAMKFERLGIFTYSREKGAPAARMPHQVPERIKQKRLEKAMLLQQKISRENNQRMIGQTIEVLVEERDDKNPFLWIGRSQMDAPEVDGNVFVHSSRKLRISDFYPVKITSVKDYDLVGQF